MAPQNGIDCNGQCLQRTLNWTNLNHTGTKQTFMQQRHVFGCHGQVLFLFHFVRKIMFS
jgi:hypothetical protein